jgi:hypothetical protein
VQFPEVLPVIQRFISLPVGALLILSMFFIETAQSANVDRALVGKWHAKAQDTNQRAGQERLLLWNIEANGSSSIGIFYSESGSLSSNSERWGVVPPNGGVESAHGTYSLRGANSFTTVDAGMPYGTVTWTKPTGTSNAPAIDTCVVRLISEPNNSTAAAFNSALIGIWQGNAVKSSGEKVAMLWRVSSSGRTVRITLLNSLSVPVDAGGGKIVTTFPNEPPARETYRVLSRDQFEITSSGERSTWTRCN